jgi:hypothetical protein
MTDQFRSNIELGLVQPGATVGTCLLHETHTPHPRYMEQHHVVPRAWQAAWHPADVELGAHDEIDMVGGTQYGTSGPATWPLVWDNRTATLCRTGHGNVHWWLVLYMRALPTAWDDLSEVFMAVHRERQHQMGDNAPERKLAQQAMLRWLEWGGDLVALRNQHLYGGI